jgi:hypothetical protein
MSPAYQAHCSALEEDNIQIRPIDYTKVYAALDDDDDDLDFDFDQDDDEAKKKNLIKTMMRPLRIGGNALKLAMALQNYPPFLFGALAIR